MSTESACRQHWIETGKRCAGVVHWIATNPEVSGRAWCGVKSPKHGTTLSTEVTCKRCLGQGGLR